MNPFPEITEETPEEFERLVEYLFDNYVIETSHTIFRLTELEVYWHSPTHPDVATYGRKHVSPKSGEWFFHYSGVDIALKSDKLNGHGGILIRSICDLNEKDKKKGIYKGPMICAMKIFSGTNAFSEEKQPYLKECKFRPSPSSAIKKSPRVGLGKTAIEAGHHKRLYNFKIKGSYDTRL